MQKSLARIEWLQCTAIFHRPSHRPGNVSHLLHPTRLCKEVVVPNVTALCLSPAIVVLINFAHSLMLFVHRLKKKDLCLIIRGKNHTNLTTAFAPVVLLLSPSPAWNVMLLLVHAVCPHQSQLIWSSLPSSSSILHFLAYLTLSSLLNLCTAFIKTHS